jgi:hypothetical protein
MDTSTVVGILIVGAAGGFPLGQWWAEIARARHDMERVWESRNHYRRRDR